MGIAKLRGQQDDRKVVLVRVRIKFVRQPVQETPQLDPQPGCPVPDQAAQKIHEGGLLPMQGICRGEEEHVGAHPEADVRDLGNIDIAYPPISALHTRGTDRPLKDGKRQYSLDRNHGQAPLDMMPPRAACTPGRYLIII